MQFDPAALSWKDWLIVGWALATVWHARSRRSQGERLGSVEQAVALIAKSVGVDLEDSSPGRPRAKRRRALEDPPG